MPEKLSPPEIIEAALGLYRLDEDFIDNDVAILFNQSTDIPLEIHSIFDLIMSGFSSDPDSILQTHNPDDPSSYAPNLLAVALELQKKDKDSEVKLIKPKTAINFLLFFESYSLHQRIQEDFDALLHQHLKPNYQLNESIKRNEEKLNESIKRMSILLDLQKSLSG